VWRLGICGATNLFPFPVCAIMACMRKALWFTPYEEETTYRRIKLCRMMWAGHIAHISKMRNTHKVLVENCE